MPVAIETSSSRGSAVRPLPLRVEDPEHADHVHTLGLIADEERNIPVRHAHHVEEPLADLKFCLSVGVAGETPLECHQLPVRGLPAGARRMSRRGIGSGRTP